MQMTAVYACVCMLSEAVAGLPLHPYRYKEDGGKEKALYLLLHDEPNPEMSSFVFRETLMIHLLLWDNAYAQIIRNGKGEIITLTLSSIPVSIRHFVSTCFNFIIVFSLQAATSSFCSCNREKNMLMSFLVKE
jgi:phage portal protein BeeE